MGFGPGNWWASQGFIVPQPFGEGTCVPPLCPTCMPSSCTTRVLTLDDLGRPVANTARCSFIFSGAMNFIWSPISLLWEGQTELEEDVSFSRFPIDPHEENKWYMWRGSSTQPLLVYDPDHSSVIASAYQLFGPWTFGGKDQPFLSDVSINSDNTHHVSKPWEDGFAALATLDRNHNGKVDGEELEPLALWFDSNRDGESHPSEIKSLKSLDVVALYFKPNRRDNEAKNVYADLGFERLVNGKIITGVAVDWYSPKGSSPAEIVTAHTNKPITRGLKDAEGKNSVELKDIDTNSLNNRSTSDGSDGENVGVSKVSSSFTGAWMWETSDRSIFPDGDSRPRGFLTFSEKGQEISGHSYTQLHFDPGQAADSMINMTILSGKKGGDSSSSNNANFTIKSQDGSVLESTMTLSPDGNSLTGSTNARVLHDGKNITVSYAWTAVRLSPR